MNDVTNDNHLSAERLQAFLEGELPSRDAARAEEHLAACARCAVERDAWQVLFEDLADLPAHRPHEGFAARVMTAVRVAEPVTLASRVRDALRAVGGGTPGGHVAPERLQDFAEGSLAARSASRVERHLGMCGSCATEAETWLTLVRRLEGLESFAPSHGFAERVMAAVEAPEHVPLAARARAWLAPLLGDSTSEHVPAGVLQDFIESSLPAPTMARVSEHLEGCVGCAAEAGTWRAVVARLDSLDRLEPSVGFSDRVVAGLRAAPAAPIRVRTRQPLRTRALAAARRLVPQTRRAWAALSGVAVTPAVTVGLVFYVVFSHPTLTLGSLASFAWWQMMDLTTAALSTLAAAAVQSSEAFGAYSLVELLASAPAMVAGGVVAYTMICALALRVLYKNLFTVRSTHGRRAHVSTP